MIEVPAKWKIVVKRDTAARSRSARRSLASPSLDKPIYTDIDKIQIQIEENHVHVA